jgi:hypothetical protein
MNLDSYKINKDSRWVGWKAWNDDEITYQAIIDLSKNYPLEDANLSTIPLYLFVVYIDGQRYGWTLKLNDTLYASRVICAAKMATDLGTIVGFTHFLDFMQNNWQYQQPVRSLPLNLSKVNELVK